MAEEKVYTLKEFADSVKLSVDQVQKHIRGGLQPSLIPFYSGTKPLIRESERQRWLDAAPLEPVRSERAS